MSLLLFICEKKWQRIDNKPIFYGTLFKNGMIYVNDLLFDTDTADSSKIISGKIGKTNFLTRVGLRHSVPLHLKTKESSPSEMSLYW